MTRRIKIIVAIMFILVSLVAVGFAAWDYTRIPEVEVDGGLEATLVVNTYDFLSIGVEPNSNTQSQYRVSAKDSTNIQCFKFYNTGFLPYDYKSGDTTKTSNTGTITAYYKIDLSSWDQEVAAVLSVELKGFENTFNNSWITSSMRTRVNNVTQEIATGNKVISKNFSSMDVMYFIVEYTITVPSGENFNYSQLIQDIDNFSVVAKIDVAN